MNAAATLHIGAGSGTRWSAKIPEGLLVLIEPNPALQQDLKDLARSREAAGHATRILSCAVSDQEGTAPFHILSLSDLSGLHDPEPLRKMLPGLRVEETISVQLRAVTALLDEIPLGESGNHLIIEAMGEEGAILGVLETAGLIDRFSRIEIQAPTEALFARGLDTNSLVARLEAADCRLVPVDVATDPDWPTLAFQPDHRLRGLRRQLQEKDQALAAAAAERNSALAAVTERESLLAAVAAERDTARAAAVRSANELETATAAKAEVVATRDRQQARITTLENNLNEARASARREAAALEDAVGRIADLEIRLEDVEAANVQFQADLEEAVAETASLAADKEEAAGLHAQQRAEWDVVRQRQQDRISLLETNLNEARAAARRLETIVSEARTVPEASQAGEEEFRAGRFMPDALAAAANGDRPAFAADEDAAAPPPAVSGQPASPASARDVQGELTRLRSENNRLGASLVRSQQDASLALRLQALAQGDLKDLQGRYAALLSRKEDQDRLLSQLVTRLGDAAAYLQGSAIAGLHQNHPAIGDVPAKALTDAGPAAKPKRKRKSDKSGGSGG